jgi:hypothetical protein
MSTQTLAIVEIVIRVDVPSLMLVLSAWWLIRR